MYSGSPSKNEKSLEGRLLKVDHINIEYLKQQKFWNDINYSQRT
jgi:hypothetical protein